MKNEKGMIMSGMLAIVTMFLLGAGIAVYNSENVVVTPANSVVSNTTNTVTNTNTGIGYKTANKIELSMTTQEKEVYNETIYQYLGESVRGTNVKALISNITSLNAQYADEGIFITIIADDIADFDDSALEEACSDAEDDNTAENVETAKVEMVELTSVIKSSSTYKITADYSDGLITTVTISEVE